MASDGMLAQAPNDCESSVHHIDAQSNLHTEIPNLSLIFVYRQWKAHTAWNYIVNYQEENFMTHELIAIVVLKSISISATLIYRLKQ